MEKTEKQIWLERGTTKIMSQPISDETKRQMLKMINDFANWAF